MSPGQRPISVAAGLHEPLSAARSAIVRLREALPRAYAARDDRDRELVALAVGDVVRALVLARRSMIAFVAEVSNVDAEGRDLIEIAARAMALGLTAPEVADARAG